MEIFFQSMAEVLQFLGDLSELAGPILILVGISSGPAIGALIGTLAGALSVVVGQGLQELAQRESRAIPNIPASPPLVSTSNSGSSSSSSSSATNVTYLSKISLFTYTNNYSTLLGGSNFGFPARNSFFQGQ